MTNACRLCSMAAPASFTTSASPASPAPAAPPLNIWKPPIPRLRKATDLPIAIGFGVRTPEQAGTASRIADAAVVASALIDTLSAHLDADGKAAPGAVDKVLDQVRELAAAVRR